MDINVRLTETIVNECLALHYKYHPAGRKSLQKFYWIPAILILISIYLIYDELQKQVVTQNFYLALLYSMFAFGYYFFMRKRMLKAGQQVIKSLGENATFTMRASEDELITQTVDGTLQSNWSQFSGALVSENIVLLYQANGTFSMLHRSFFAPNDFDLFKTLVSTSVSPLIKAGTKF
jgi:hypothetical protein